MCYIICESVTESLGTEGTAGNNALAVGKERNRHGHAQNDTLVKRSERAFLFCFASGDMILARNHNLRIFGFSSSTIRR